jgi:hypothetical protein
MYRGFEAVLAVTMKSTISWDVMPWAPDYMVFHPRRQYCSHKYTVWAKCKVRADCLYNYCCVLKGEVQNDTYILLISLKSCCILVTLGTGTV